MGKVTSLDVGASFLVSSLGSFCRKVVEQNQRKSYECGSSHSKVVACASYVQLAEL
jgi:hypothetical protein